ncbi:hypothetical protein EF918_35955, partial [Streptomyces sp. WAC06614]
MDEPGADAAQGALAECVDAPGPGTAQAAEADGVDEPGADAAEGAVAECVDAPGPGTAQGAEADGADGPEVAPGASTHS